jgi:hypothetical protein
MIFLDDPDSKSKTAIKTVLPKNQYGYLYGVRPVELEFDSDGTPTEAPDQLWETLSPEIPQLNSVVEV